MIQHLESPRLKLDADCGFRIQTELIPSEASEELGFSDGRVADENDLEDIVDLLVESAVQIRHLEFQSNRKVKSEVFPMGFLFL